MTCSICGGDIRDDGDDGEVGWSQSAFCTADGSRFIHYECQHIEQPSRPAPPPPKVDPSQYLTLPAAAQLLGISTQTLRRRIKAGTLAAFRLAGGQTILLERAALLRLLEPL